MINQHTDFYLSVDNVYARLREEYLKYGRLIIACDFDDTLYDYHKQGRTYYDIIGLLRRWKDKAEIIITSCINEGDDARVKIIMDYLIDNDIPFDKVNEQSAHSPTPKSAKIYYNVLLDDRAGLNECYEVLVQLITEIENNTLEDGGHGDV